MLHISRQKFLFSHRCYNKFYNAKSSFILLVNFFSSTITVSSTNKYTKKTSNRCKQSSKNEENLKTINKTPMDNFIHQFRKVHLVHPSPVKQENNVNYSLKTVNSDVIQNIKNDMLFVKPNPLLFNEDKSLMRLKLEENILKTGVKNIILPSTPKFNDMTNKIETTNIKDLLLLSQDKDQLIEKKNLQFSFPSETSGRRSQSKAEKAPEICKEAIKEITQVLPNVVCTSCIIELLDSKRGSEAYTALQNYDKQGIFPDFKVFLMLAAWTGIHGLVENILFIKSQAMKRYSKEYKSNLSFDHYYASALFNAGHSDKAITILEKLHRQHPKGQKKIKDTTALLISAMIGNVNEDIESKILELVDVLWKDLHSINPVLSLWRACFTSVLHRHHVVAFSLLDKYPDLKDKLHLKLESIIKLAIQNGDTDVLHRLIQVLLECNLYEYLPDALGSLLQLQCMNGDLYGADETIKFACKMKISLDFKQIQRFIALLNYHRLPAARSLIASRLKSTTLPFLFRQIYKAPTIMYKF